MINTVDPLVEQALEATYDTTIGRRLRWRGEDRQPTVAGAELVTALEDAGARPAWALEGMQVLAPADALEVASRALVDMRLVAPGMSSVRAGIAFYRQMTLRRLVLVRGSDPHVRTTGFLGPGHYRDAIDDAAETAVAALAGR